MQVFLFSKTCSFQYTFHDMSEAKFVPSIPEHKPHKFKAELTARVEAAKASRSREMVETKWAKLTMTPEQKRYEKTLARSIRQERCFNHFVNARTSARCLSSTWPRSFA